ncbi:hypothetical protein CJ030_MR6G013858 [Morella rubra]|uniref:Uncharacterized protein n=1 Tax=Morella rubra TaxID=262757 RepID=A0A6A1VDW4_9ROSI|nr:hypothetical protein CJ030_MR6G013858 [Morella rubra]
MNKRLRTSSQADAEESSAPGLSLDEHTAVIMSRSVVVERHIQLADFYELRFEDRTLPEIVEQAGWLPFSRGPGKNGSVTVAVRVREVIHEVEIFAEVLGTKAGYMRGLGRSVRSVGSSSSVSSVDLSRRLEEARLQIEETRARQLEYEALLVKWSDMEQTMREQLMAE